MERKKPLHQGRPARTVGAEAPGLSTSPHTPSVAVVGAGPAGTTLALGLLQHGCQVTLVTDRTAEEIRGGSVMSSQVTFESALEVEAAFGIPALLPPAPRIGRMAFDVTYADGGSASFTTPFAAPARSVDLRVKVPALLDAVARCSRL